MLSGMGNYLGGSAPMTQSNTACCTPSAGWEDKPENYCVTSYLVRMTWEASVEIIQEDNRPSGFAPATLKPILMALKSVAEMN